MKPKNGNKTEAQRKAFRNYEARTRAKLLADLAKARPPKDSWWARPVPRDEFYAIAAKQYEDRMCKFVVVGNDTFN